MGDFRRFFLRGLAILLPTLVTVGILMWAWGFLSKNIAEPINRGVRVTFIWVAPKIVGGPGMPQWYHISTDELDTARKAAAPMKLSDESLLWRLRREGLRDYWKTHYWGSLNLIGFIVAVILVYLAGVLVGNLIGRRVYAKIESLVVRLPIVKQVYPSVKQVTDFLVGSGEGKSKTLSDGRVCLIEYPRKGIWTVGLMTGQTLAAIEHISGKRCVTVFIPSSPTPFTGYTITVPEDEVYALPISMDETIRFVVSGGVLVPDSQKPTHSPPRINESEIRGQIADDADLAGSAGGAMMEEEGRNRPGRASA